MEDCLEQNMSLIKRLRPDLYKKLKEVNNRIMKNYYKKSKKRIY